MRLGLVVVAVLAIAAPVSAHPLDVGYLKIDATDATAVAIDLDLAANVASSAYRRVAIETDAGPCTWGATSSELRASTNTLAQHAIAVCPRGATSLRWTLPFVDDLSPAFQLLVKTHGFAGDHVAIVDRAARTLALAGATSRVGLGTFVAAGVKHIGAAPSEWHDANGWKLAAGIDHIMFLVALLLAGGTLFELFGIATGFTLGHSVTLALAASGIVRPPASVIEPLIAVTIAIAAVEAFRGRRHRWKIAAVFGCVHGFAFASALSELDLAGGLARPLFGFNLGVELGQIALVALLAPVILAIHRARPAVARGIVRAAAAAIFVAAVYWFVTRI